MNPPPGPAAAPGSGSGPDDLEWRRVYFEHAAVVYRCAYRAALGVREAAEDATQEAFMEAVRDWPEFRRLPASEQRRQLCSRARWRVIDSWRTTSAEHLTDALPDQPGPWDENTVLAGITADIFWKEINVSVPVRAARAAYLRWNLEWTMNEIAFHLGVDRATVLRDLRAVHAAARRPGNGRKAGPEFEGREA